MASYLLASSQIEDNTSTNAQDIVFQTKNILDNQFINVFEQLVKFSNDPSILSVISKEPSEIEPDDYVNVHRTLNQIYKAPNSIIDSILVDIHHGQFTLSKSDYEVGDFTVDYESFREIFDANSEGFYWSGLHEENILGQGKDEVFSVYKHIGSKESESEGFIIFNLNKKFVENVINKSLIGENGYLILINDQGLVSFKDVSEPYQIDKSVLSHIQQLTDEEGSFTFQKPEGKKMKLFYNTLELNEWKIAAAIPEEEILNKINYIKYLILFVVVFVGLISVLLGNVLTKYVLTPFYRLVDGMAVIQNQNQPIQLKEFAPKEIQSLQTGINELMERVNELVKQTKREQQEIRQLELQVMHAQINPHFLYNTLYSIKGLCDMELTEDASQMVSALSNFFRISISKGQEIITVKDEIEHISNYLFIQEMRYGDDFQYEINVDPSVEKYNIIKLTLQPLVENAIYHGVKQKRGVGKIQVIGYKQDNDLCFEVKDNGPGIPPERLKEIKTSLENRNQDQKIGFGVRSVHERIRIHYGEPYGLHIESTPEVGTTVKVMIPLVKGQVE